MSMGIIETCTTWWPSPKGQRVKEGNSMSCLRRVQQGSETEAIVFPSAELVVLHSAPTVRVRDELLKLPYEVLL